MLRVANGVRAAGFGERARQQVVRNLFFQFLLFLAADMACFGFLDLGDFVVQNIAHHGGGQHFFGFFQRHRPCVLRGEHEFERKAVRRREAFAEPVQAGNGGEFVLLQAFVQRFGREIGGFGEDVKGNLFEPHDGVALNG